MTTTFRLTPHTTASGSGPHVAPPAAPAGAEPVPTTGTSDDSGRPSVRVVLSAFVVLAIAWAVAVFLIHDSKYPPAGSAKPVAGLTIFAVFFVAAQAIERLLEPVASLLDPKAGDALAEASGKASEAAAAAAAKLHSGNAESIKAAITATQAKLNDAADKKARAATSKANRKIIFWAVASAVAVLAASGMKLYFLRTVGIATPDRALEVLATGLIIGSGTQPLHDLVSLISAKADTSKAAAGRS